MDCRCSRATGEASDWFRALIREEIAAHFREQHETRRRFDRAALRMADKADAAHTPNTVDPL